MEAVAYSTFRKDLRAYLDKTRDAALLLVASKEPSANVVVMNAMDATASLKTRKSNRTRV